MIKWAEQQCRKEQHVSANKEQHVSPNKEQHVSPNKEQHVTANDEQLRKVLGDLIYFIRFPIMERKYFTHEVSTNKGNNKITELRTILQRESQNS
jgi:hypothetical protein